jgi:uncharacterized membrane protein HdeD (DUF308 family)
VAFEVPLARSMVVIPAKNWWSLLIRGLVAISLGVLTVVNHGMKLGTLVLLFGCYALIDGLVSFAGIMRAAEGHERWASLLVEAVAGITVGAIALAWPSLSAMSLVYIIAAWALLTGLVEIAASVRLRRHVEGEWLLALSGVASLVLGILILALPLAGPLAIAYWVGAYAFVFGGLLVGLGFRLRAWDRRLPRSAVRPTGDRTRHVSAERHEHVRR